MVCLVNTRNKVGEEYTYPSSMPVETSGHRRCDFHFLLYIGEVSLHDISRVLNMKGVHLPEPALDW
jgi:hypothetical protein